MAELRSSVFPYNADAQVMGRNIDWADADPKCAASGEKTWKKVEQKDALKLVSDPRFRRLLVSLPERIQEVVHAIAENRRVTTPVAVLEERAAAMQRIAAAAPVSGKPAAQARQSVSKSDIIDAVVGVLKDADDAGDMSVKLKSIELLAKVEQLLGSKPQEDREITINVITGVPR